MTPTRSSFFEVKPATGPNVLWLCVGPQEWTAHVDEAEKFAKRILAAVDEKRGKAASS